jgi:hypothetical protein
VDEKLNVKPQLKQITMKSEITSDNKLSVRTSMPEFELLTTETNVLNTTK